MGIWLLIDYSYQLWTLNIDHNLCYFVAEYAVFMQKMLFVAVLLCDFYANCVDIMQIVLFLCKLWGFYANSAVLMQIITFVTIYAVLSQMTFLSQNTRFSRHFWVCYQALWLQQALFWKITIKFALQISNSMLKSALQSLQCNLS